MPVLSGRSKIRRQALAWLTRLHSGELDASEHQAFQTWLAGDREHWREFVRARRFWNALGELAPVELPELEAARNYRPQRFRDRIPARLLAACFSFMTLALLVGSVAGIAKVTEQHRTAWGERRHLSLADGSEVDLNGDTGLGIVWLADARIFRLEKGEAVFTAAHDSRRTFEVYAGTARVRDLGTRFAVRRSGAEVRVTVEQGEVEVAAGPEVSRRLRRNETLSHAGGVLSPAARIDAVDALAWREGKLVFKSRPLADVLAEVRRYHPVEFVLSDPGLAGQKISGVFRLESLKPLLDSLEATLSLRVEWMDGQRILIRR